MTDPMDNELKHLLKQNPPPKALQAAEKQAIEAAMAAFDKKNAYSRQGISIGRRLMGAARKLLNPNDGAFMKKSHIVAGGLCAATLCVALLNTTALNKQAIIGEPQPAVVTSSNPSVSHSAKEDANKIQPVEMQQEGIQATDSVHGIKVSPKQITVSSKSIEPPPLPTISAPAAPAPQLAASTIPLPASRPSSAALMPAEKKTEMPALKGKAAEQNVHHPMIVASGPNLTPPARMQSFAADSAVGGASGVMMESDAMYPYPQPGYHDEGRDKFEHVKDNPLKVVKEEPVSTFSIDVDTASYAFMRASLNNNVLPQKDSVRIEEMINYFPYDYAPSRDKSQPFATSVSVMPSPWNKGTKLIHIGIKGYELPKADKPHSNLVFLIDTSGSMNEPNKLPLLKNSMKLLLDSLEPDDTVAIVTYAGNAGVALEPTKVSDKQKILSTIDTFNASGSTAGAEGIRQAYDLAERNFDKKGVNRVILATDGDFNVGITDPNELKSYIERKRDSGVFLSVLGFGQGNYNDAMMQTLAQNGNGNAAYIDTLNEARKVLVEEAGSTLFTIAKDVKIQVEFNPSQVSEYRLIGYETRMLNREDFNNDKVDAGEIGAGHTVTAIYEITPAGSDAKLVDDLRYSEGKKESIAAPKDGGSGEYAFLKIRYKLPNEEKSKLLTTPIDSKLEVSAIERASTEARFATSVAAFGQLLRGESMTQNFSYDDVISLAQSAKGADNFGYRAEFINLVRMAKSAAGLKPLNSGGGISTSPIVVEPQPVPMTRGID